MRATGVAKSIFSVFTMTAMCWSCAAPGQSRIHFGQKTDSVSVPHLEKVISLSSSRPPRSLAQHAEVIVVSGYQPPSRPPGQGVEVYVDRPGHKVLLVLTSYERVIWHVDASRGTRVSGIVASAHHTPIVTSEVSAPGYRMRLPYSYSTGNRNFVDLLRKMHAVFGIDHVDAFRGRYELPAHVRIARIEPNNGRLSMEWPQPETPRGGFRFPLASVAGSVVMWSLTGPIGGGANTRIRNAHTTLAPDGSMYTFGRDGLRARNPETGRHHSYPLPANFPRVSWPEGVAYDSKRHLVSVVTLGGEGYLYRLDAQAGKWADYRSLNNVDLYSICYDPVADRYVAWASRGRLLFISAAGEVLFYRKVADGMQGFGRIYDSGNEMAPHLKLVARGNKVAMIYAPGGRVRRIWYYNVETRQIMLTFKRT